MYILIYKYFESHWHSCQKELPAGSVSLELSLQGAESYIKKGTLNNFIFNLTQGSALLFQHSQASVPLKLYGQTHMVTASSFPTAQVFWHCSAPWPRGHFTAVIHTQPSATGRPAERWGLRKLNWYISLFLAGMKVPSSESVSGKLEWSQPNSLRILNQHIVNGIDLPYSEC